MSVIAVAGGTGKLGRAIVDALNATGKFKVLVLGREASEAKTKEIGAKTIAVNYADIRSMTEILESNKVETVISTLNVIEGTTPEIALINAAEKASSTKRFIPSSWGIPYTEKVATIFLPGRYKRDTVVALEASTLEYTSIYNGYFTDYFVLPKVKSYIMPFSIVLDIGHNFAAIPGSGDVPVAFTHTWDIAKYVAAYVQKSVWENEVYIIGDKVTWNQFLKLVEDAKRTKFNVVHDALEKLGKGEVTELPSHQTFYPFFPKQLLQGLLATFGILFEKGLFDLEPEKTLNQDFPEIKARTVKELVDEAWRV